MMDLIGIKYNRIKMKKILTISLLFIGLIANGQHHVVRALLNQSETSGCDTVITSSIDTSSLFQKVVVWTDFSESSGNLIDKSVNGLDGVNTGVTYQYGAEDSYFYDAVDYTTIDDDDDLTQTGAFAIAAKFTTPSAFDAFYGLTGKENEFIIVSPTGTYFEFRIHGSGTTEYMKAATPTLNTSTEYFIVFNYNGNENSTGISISVNGGSDAATARFGSDRVISNTANDFFIGSINAGTNGLNGALEQLILFQDSLTSSEITELYNSGTELSYNDLFTTTYDTTHVNCPEVPTPDPSPIGGNYFTNGDYFVDNTGTGGDTLTFTQMQDSLSAGVWGAGDTVLIKAGLDYYTDGLDINVSGSVGDPFVLGAFGEGEMPVIYGSEIVTGTWTLHSGNIWKTTKSGTISQVFEDNVKLKSARYPNTGYADITTKTSTTNITASSLPNIDHTGSLMYVRTESWALESRTVTNSTNTNTTLALSSAPYYAYAMQVGSGIFLTDNLAYLDEAGEWYSDGSTLYVYSPDGTSPSDNIVRVSVVDDVIDITNQSYIEIAYLDLQQANTKGVLIDNSDYITIDSINVENCDIIGIDIDDQGSSNITVMESVINGSYAFGIKSLGGSHLFKDNTIENIGLFDDIGFGGNSATALDRNGQIGVGVYLTEAPSGNNIVRYNTVRNVGYNGIWHYWNPDILIEYNYINNACLTIGDGSGIYCFGDKYNPGVEDSDGGIIRYNIIDGVLGTLAGKGNNSRREGNGVYTDELIRYTNVHDNIIANVTEGGIKQHDNDYVYARSNILFNCGMGLNPLSSSATTHMKSNIVINTDNVIPREGSKGYLALAKTTELAKLDSNAYYDFHVNPETPFRDGTNFTDKTFSQFQTMLGEDANSTFDGTALDAGQTEVLLYNATKVAVVQDLSGFTYEDLDGNAVTSLTLQPFTGVILKKTPL